ncbi:MAG: hypothetical protein KGL56_13535 [Alphaproteobacteria bacterium]|nr:hypothetical protein [Alphaproteobacteria bacterium]
MTAWRNWPAMALGLATILLIVPLWCVHSPGMPDYPAHIAGFYMIAGGARTTPLSTYYDIHWTLVPNLASELAVPVLMKFLPLEVAAKLFLSVAVGLWTLGPAAIQRALFGRVGVASLAAAFFAYNANYTWGFFNYYFAAGLSFVVFAAWIASAGRCNTLRVLGFTLAICVLYLCHLVAVFILGVLIFCYELSQVIEERDFAIKALFFRALPVGLIFLPAASAFLFFKPTGGEGGKLAFDFTDTIGDRLASTIQYAYSEPAYLLIGALAVLVLAGLMYDKLRIHPSMKILVLVLAVLTVVSPEWALGGWGVHLRLPAVLGAMLFATMELRVGPRSKALVAAALLLSAVWISTALARSWRGYDRQYSEFRAALHQVPEGTRLVTVLDSDSLDYSPDVTVPDQPYWHMAEFAIVDRDAFTPLMFATKGQHIVQVKPPYDNFAAKTAQQGSPPDVSDLSDLSTGNVVDDPDIAETFPYLKFFQCHFNMAVVIRGKGAPSDVPDFLTLRHQGSFFALYDIQPTKACARK